MVHSKNNNKDIAPQLACLAQQIQAWQGDLLQGNSQRPAMYQLKLAYKNLKAERRAATTKRKQHLTFRKKNFFIEGKKTQASAIASIQRAEQRSRCFRKFQSYTKSPRTAGGLAYVIQEDFNGEPTRIQQPDELANVLSMCNRKHFPKPKAHHLHNLH
jgi:hypothetical protein